MGQETGTGGSRDTEVILTAAQGVRWKGIQEGNRFDEWCMMVYGWCKRGTELYPVGREMA